jgi:hypothetical protein
VSYRLGLRMVWRYKSIAASNDESWELHMSERGALENFFFFFKKAVERVNAE